MRDRVAPNRVRHETNLGSYQVLFGLLGIYVGLLVAANAAGSKLIAVGSLTASATVFAYALTFPITDIVAEVYGKRIANWFVTIGLFVVIGATVFYQISLYSPASPLYKDQQAFSAVFSLSPRLLIGGLAAYLVSQYLDVWLYHKIGEWTNGEKLWLRNNGSTLISQFVDTVIFMVVAFYGVVPVGALWGLILGQYAIKCVIAILDTPIVYWAVSAIKKHLGH